MKGMRALGLALVLLGAVLASAQADTTPPTLEIAKVSGTSLTLTFTETLGAAPSLANSAFTVKKTPQGGGEQTVALSGAPSISDATVTLTLATAVVSTDTAVQVRYTKPTSGANNTLQDAAGNEVASFTQEIDTTPPTLTGGEIDGGTLTLTFDEPLDENWIPGPSFDLNLEYRLCEGDRSYCHQDVDGAHTGYDLPGFPLTCWHSFLARGEVMISGNTVTMVGLGNNRAVSGRCAGLSHDIDNLPSTTKKLRDLAGNELREIKPTFLDNHTAPSAWGVTVNRAALALTFENALDGNAEPAANAFTVEVANQWRGVTAVDVNGYTVTLTLASAVTVGQAVRVRYTQPTSGTKLQDRNSNVVKTFDFKAAENRTVPEGPTPPEVWDIKANGATLWLIYDRDLDRSSRPAAGDFAVTGGGGSGGRWTVSNVALSGRTVTLTLAPALTYRRIVLMSYTVGSNPIRDRAGNESENFTDLWVRNQTPHGDGGSGGSGGGSGGGSSRPRDDHGNTAGSATRVQPGGRTAGQLDTRSDVDYFTLTAPHAGVLVVETTGSTATRGTVWQDGAEVATADSGGADQNFRLSVRVEAGPVVMAVRGTGQQTGRYTLQTTLVIGYLENPTSRSFQSGLGVISGWVCEAEGVTVEIEKASGEVVELAAAYGTERADTAGVCGDSDNGFGVLVNWNLLGDGDHSVVVLVDGIELGRAPVTVTTLGAEFVEGLAGSFPIEDFPRAGEQVRVVWQESQQNFVLAPAELGATVAPTPSSGAIEGVLENPRPASFQSGIGVISGWACEAEAVVIEIDGQVIAAAAGTERADTLDRCGDVDNGFGLLVNWAEFGAGAHEVVALVDGAELSRATVTVTLVDEAEPYMRGLAKRVEVPGFPTPEETVTLEWQEAQQNFVITEVD